MWTSLCAGAVSSESGWIHPGCLPMDRPVSVCPRTNGYRKIPMVGGWIFPSTVVWVLELLWNSGRYVSSCTTVIGGKQIIIAYIPSSAGTNRRGAGGILFPRFPDADSVHRFICSLAACVQRFISIPNKIHLCSLVDCVQRFISIPDNCTLTPLDTGPKPGVPVSSSEDTGECGGR